MVNFVLVGVCFVQTKMGPNGPKRATNLYKNMFLGPFTFLKQKTKKGKVKKKLPGWIGRW